MILRQGACGFLRKESANSMLEGANCCFFKAQILNINPLHWLWWGLQAASRPLRLDMQLNPYQSQRAGMEPITVRFFEQ